MSQGGRCQVHGCAGPMFGQMISCAPHWSLLSDDLRLALVRAYDQLEQERGDGNPRRATRDALARLRAQADDEWEAVRGRIADRLQPAGTAYGRAWRRAVNVMAAEAVEVVDLNAPGPPS